MSLLLLFRADWRFRFRVGSALTNTVDGVMTVSHDLARQAINTRKMICLLTGNANVKCLILLLPDNFPSRSLNRVGQVIFPRPTCAKRCGSSSPQQAPSFKLEEESKYSYVLCVFNFQLREYGDGPSTKRGSL